MSPTLIIFLARLATDSDYYAEFQKNPAEVMYDAGLSVSESETILAGKTDELARTVIEGEFDPSDAGQAAIDPTGYGAGGYGPGMPYGFVPVFIPVVYMPMPISPYPMAMNPFGQGWVPYAPPMVPTQAQQPYPVSSPPQSPFAVYLTTQSPGSGQPSSFSPAHYVTPGRRRASSSPPPQSPRAVYVVTQPPKPQR